MKILTINITLITIVIAIWGAILSTVLFIIRIVEYLRKVRIEYCLKYHEFTLPKNSEMKPFIHFDIINSSSNVVNIKGIYIETFNNYLLKRSNKKSIIVMQKSVRITPKDNYEISIDLTEMKLDYQTIMDKINSHHNRNYSAYVMKYNNSKVYSRKNSKVKNLNSFVKNIQIN